MITDKDYEDLLKQGIQLFCRCTYCDEEFEGIGDAQDHLYREHEEEKKLRK